MADREKRQDPRVTATFKVEYESFDKFLLEYAEDISRGGIFLATDFAMPLGTIVRLVLHLPGGPDSVQVVGQVVHHRPPSLAKRMGKSPGMGVEFLDIDSEALRKVRTFVENSARAAAGAPAAAPPRPVAASPATPARGASASPVTPPRLAAPPPPGLAPASPAAPARGASASPITPPRLAAPSPAAPARGASASPITPPRLAAPPPPGLAPASPAPPPRGASASPITPPRLAAPSPAPPPGPPSSPANDSAAPSGATAGPGIDTLVVCGDAASGRAIAAALGPDFTVRTVDDGLRVLAECTRARPRLVVATAELPGMPGHELLRAVRDHRTLGGLPFILLATRGKTAEDEKRRLAVLRAGADDLVSWPAGAPQLAGRAQRILKHADAPAALAGRRALRGELEQVGTGTLLGLLEMEKKTGYLLVVREGESALLGFREGRIVHADVRPALAGKDRVFYVLDWPGGRFEFVSQDVGGEDDIHTTVSHLLLEHAQRSDEEAEARRRTDRPERSKPG